MAPCSPVDPIRYDPREHGARCDHCILSRLRVGHPVAPEIHPGGGRIAVVGEMPGETETELLRPFVGVAGGILTRGIEAAGLTREDTDLFNVGACRPPKNNYKAILAQLDKINERRIAAGEEPLPTPAQCCYPQLAGWLAHYDCIIPTGAVALHTVLPDVRVGILAVRGTMYTTEAFGRRALVLPTLHPAFVSRGRRWEWVFEGDIARARRYFEGRLEWTEPDAVYLPSVGRIRDYLRALRDRGQPVVYDLETDSIEALDAKVRCIGIGTVEGGMVIPTLAIDGRSRFYCDRDLRLIEDEVRAFLVDPRVPKVGHNAGNYDRICVEQWLGVRPTPLIDTLVLHRVGRWSELPHNLGFVGSTLTDVHAWKAGKIATHARTDAELWRYNLLDVVVNARIFPRVLAQAVETQQIQVAKLDHAVQDLCVTMHRVGLLVDQGVDAQGRPRPVPVIPSGEDAGAPDLRVFGRAQWDAKLTREADEARAICRKVLGRRFDPGIDRDDFLLDEDEPEAGHDEALFETVAVDFNANSADQLRRLLFEVWKLPPVTFTDSGEPSTGDAVLRALVVDATIPEDKRRVIRAVRTVRRRIKWRGYARGARYEPGAPGCHVARDGRIHAHWNSTGKGSGDDGATTSGRMTSSPNMQNWPTGMRSILVAPPGHVLVEADGDQIELRYIAALSGCRFYLEVFERGQELPPNHPEGDPHRRTMIAVFGAAAVKSAAGQPSCWRGKWNNKGEGTYKKMRDLAKRVQYAGQYGADPPTVHRVITSAENAKGELIYADQSLRAVRNMLTAWKKNVPEIVAWWYATMETFYRQGYLEEVVTGRRRYFTDGAQPKKSGIDSHLINFPVQAGTAGLMNRAGIAVAKAFPYGFGGPNTGICGQFHDAIALETPERDGEEVARVLGAEMTQTHPALPGVVFTAGPGIGRRLIEV